MLNRLRSVGQRLESLTKPEDKRHPKFQQHVDFIAIWGPSAFKAVGAASAAFVLYGAFHCVYGNLMRGLKFAKLVGGPLLYIAYNGHTLSANLQTISQQLDSYCPQKGMKQEHKDKFNAQLQQGTIYFGPIANKIAALFILIYQLEKTSK